MFLASFPDHVHARGTGTLISKDCFVTAAHCLYDKLHGFVKEEAAEFYVGIQTGSFYAKKASIKEARIHKAYIIGVDEDDIEKQNHYDLAVVKIDQDLGNQVGWASLKAYKDEDLIDLRVNITGYPSPETGTFNTYFMYTMEGPIKQVSPYRIFYDIDTSGGQSGSGVWKFGANNIVDCLAVHTNGFTLKDSYNNGTRINIEHFDMIKEWLDSLS